MAIGLGLLKLYNGSREDLLLELPGTLTMSLLLASPHIVAFAALRAGPAARPPLLLASALLSFVSMGVSLAGVGIVFLPSAVLYAVGAALALGQAPGWRTRGAALLLSVAAVGSSTLLPYGFFRLFSGPPEQHCWETVRYADGRVETRERVDTVPGEGGMGMSFGAQAPGVTSQQGHCVSDVATLAEAAQGVGFWAIGMAGLGAVWVAGSRRGS